MLSALKRERLGQLDCLIRQGYSPQKTIILCHGYGANAEDLAPLATLLDPKGTYRWLFPDAPLALALPWGLSGRAWFPLDAFAVEEARLTGKPLDWRDFSPPGLDSARDALASAIRQLLTQEPSLSLYLGGFSQGGVIALDACLQLSLPVKGLLLLSSTLVCKQVWKDKLRQHPPCSFFMSHGIQDQILPFERAEELFQLLKEHHWLGQLHTFTGGHEIPSELWPALENFISGF